MHKIKRVAVDDYIARLNSHYSTRIARLKCCDVDPDLFGGGKEVGFFKSGIWEFRCPKCLHQGGDGSTPNSAAGYWNKSLDNQQGE